MTTSAAHDELNELLRDKDTHTVHPEDRHNASDHSDDESDHAADFLEHTDTDDELDIPKDMRSNYYLPSIKSEANTGPKGVIADAHAFEQAKKQARRSLWRKTTPPNSYTVTAYHDEKSDGEDSEDSFMKKWRESRLRDLQNAGQRIRSRTTSPSRRLYGDLTTVDALGYLDAVEKGPRDTVVVVFIYDDTSETSNLVESYMLEVAQRNNTTRFIRLHYEDAEIEIAGVPAVIAYKNGDMLERGSLVPVLDALPDDSELSVVSLETCFRSRNFI